MCVVLVAAGVVYSVGAVGDVDVEDDADAGARVV